jgi:hypothetical protein
MSHVMSMGRWTIVAGALLLSACEPDPLDALASAGRGPVTAVRAEAIKFGGEATPLAGVVLEPEGEAALRTLVLGREVERLAGGSAAAHLRLVDGRVWVQGRLLERGWARVRTTADDRALARQMLTLEAKARAARRGGWAGENWRVRLPGETAGVRGFAIVEGRVRRVDRRGQSVFLDFGADPREDFSVRVPLDAAEAFSAAGLSFDQLAGALVRVRGEVRPGRWGPTMTLDHPEALERLTEP